MSYAKFVVRHYKQKEDYTYESSYTTLPAFDVRVKTAIGDKRDTFQFKILNIEDTYNTFLDTGDKIDIYLLVDEETPSSDNLIMSGAIKNIQKDLNADNEIFIVDGINYSEVIMNALIFVSRDEGGNAINVIRDMINDVNRRSAAFLGSKFFITWNSGNPDGTGWPTLQKVNEFYKSGIYMMEKYLTGDFVPDNTRYFWYINKDNELVIRARDTVISQSGGQNITLTDGQDFYGLKIGSDISEVKNFVVYKCGRTPKGKIIMGYADNPVSRAKHGFKYHLLIREEIANQLMENEQLTNGTEFSADKLFPSSYSYTTNYTSTIEYDEKGVSATIGSPVEVDNDDEWEFAFKKEANARGAIEAQAFINDYANGYLQITGDTPLDLTYQVGQLIIFNSERFGLNNKLLRIHELDYSIDGLRIVMQEDEATI